MNSQSERELGFTRKRRLILGIVLVSVVILLLVAWIVSSSGVDAGLQIMREGNVEDVREAVKLLMDAYTSMISLASAAFGAVAFLITLQQSQRSRLTPRAWFMLMSGVILLAGALILALVGRELLLTMLAHNAVEINLTSLACARWAGYGCMVIAAVLIALFGAEVAAAPIEPGLSGADSRAALEVAAENTAIVRS
jgi:hypothetical protein